MRFIIFILGLAIGAYAMHVYDQRELGSAGYAEASGPRQDAVSQKIEQWHLTPEDIRADLARTGQVVRENTHQVGDRLSDARIVAEIKAKYLLDKDLSAVDIHVDSSNGVVALTGTVASADLIGKAVVLALDTGGVRTVTARLSVRS